MKDCIIYSVKTAAWCVFRVPGKCDGGVFNPLVPQTDSGASRRLSQHVKGAVHPKMEIRSACFQPRAYRVGWGFKVETTFLEPHTKRLYTACTAKPKCLEVPRTQTDGWLSSTLCFKPEIFTEVAMLLGFFFVVVFYILKTSPHLLPLFRRMPQRCFPVTHQKCFFLSTTKLNPTLYPLWGE